MPAKDVVGVIVLLVLLALWTTPVAGAETYDDPRIPGTLEEITGNKIASYSFFFVLAGLCVLLIFRGIRSR